MLKHTELSLAPVETPQDQPAPGSTPIVCPRCSYARQATDTAPAWQCPRCEVAYNKAQAAAGTAPRRKSVNDDDEDDDHQGGRPVRVRRATPKRGPPWMLIALGAGAILLVALMAWKSSSDKARAEAAKAAALAAQQAQAAQLAQQERAAAQAPSALKPLETRWHFGEGAEVLPAVRSLAEGGDTRAMVVLANMLHGSFDRVNQDKSPGVPKNHVEAMEWLNKAAAQGDVVAAVRLGGIYERGEDEPRQPSLAENWYLKAARQGHAPGLYSLGYLYARGLEPVGKRPVAGYMLLELATQASREQPWRDDLLPEQHTASSASSERDRLGRDMSPDDIAEAKRRAQAWKPGQPLGL
ncbi:MAG: sel1 repeat family protein [Comamonadaceae bacterium]|nr:MAG: sel1 repeat family protein [Comamonadaceae bacterium]